jgi:sugar phosphate isomerase/epimerase
MTDRLSTTSFNWLRLGGSSDPGREPEPEWPLTTVLDGVASAGFAHVGLDLATVRAFLGGDGAMNAVADALRSRGLACSDVGVLPLGTGDVRATAETLASLASATGSRTCIASLVASLDPDAAIAELEDCLEILARAETRVALEFVAYFGLTRLSDAVPICRAVGWDRCGLLIDTWHFFRSGAPWAELRSLDGTQIALVHVNDGPNETSGDPVEEGRFRRLPPGHGEFPLAEFAAVLEEIGYTGTVSAEVLSAAVRVRPPAEGARLLRAALLETFA